MRALSYRSAGIFIRIPVAISIRYGIPIQILITIKRIFATTGESHKDTKWLATRQSWMNGICSKTEPIRPEVVKSLET